jgi:hypothetical protein
MIQTDPIFLGVVPRGARSYVAEQIVRLDKPLFNAGAGRFSVIEAAVKEGFPATHVHASDIGLFSSLISSPRSSLRSRGSRCPQPSVLAPVRNDAIPSPLLSFPRRDGDWNVCPSPRKRAAQGTRLPVFPPANRWAYRTSNGQ